MESAAEWKGTQWMGSTQFNANQSGFTSPTFQWTKPSGAIGGRTSDSSLDLTIADAGIGNYVQGIGLGGDAGGQGMTSTSNAKVTVSDPNVTLSSDYTVNWHVPFEWDSAPVVSAGAPILFSQQGYVVDGNGNYSTTLEINVPAKINIEPKVTQFKLVTKDSVNAFGAILGVGSAVSGAVAAATVVTGVGLGPPGWIALGLAVAGGGATYVAGQMPASSPVDISVNYGQYKADMRFQKMINDARALDPNAYPNEIPRCTNNVTFVNAAVQRIDELEAEYGANDNSVWDHDGNYKRNLTCTAVAGRLADVEDWSGDQYQHNGFADRCLMNVVKPGGVFYAYTWTSTPTVITPPPPTGGTP